MDYRSNCLVPAEVPICRATSLAVAFYLLLLGAGRPGRWRESSNRVITTHSLAHVSNIPPDLLSPGKRRRNSLQPNFPRMFMFLFSGLSSIISKLICF